MGKASGVSRDFKELRDRIKELKKVGGFCSTNDLVRAFDKTYRTLVRVKAHVVDRLNQMGLNEPHASDDFYSVFLAIHKASLNTSAICGECYCLVEDKLSRCPFCLEALVEPEKILEGEKIKIDLNIPFNAPPNWEIDYSGESIGQDDPNRNLPPEIKPITKKDLIPGPKGKNPGGKKPRNYRRAEKNDHKKELEGYIRKLHFGRKIPFSREDLESFRRQDILSIYYLVLGGKQSPDPKAWQIPSAALINIILEKQGTTPIEPAPPPSVRTEFLKIEGRTDGSPRA